MTAKAKTEPIRDTRVPTLARDMLISFISTTGMMPGDSEAMRQFVRHARDFYSEVDAPTKPRGKARENDDEGSGHAELLADD